MTMSARFLIHHHLSSTYSSSDPNVYFHHAVIATIRKHNCNYLHVFINYKVFGGAAPFFCLNESSDYQNTRWRPKNGDTLCHGLLQWMGVIS